MTGTITNFKAANNSTINIDGVGYFVENANKPYSLANPDSVTLRFELRSGDHWTSPDFTDPTTSERCEIASSAKFPNGQQVNIAYDFMIEPGAPNTASWIVLGQMHESNVPDSPPFAVELVNGDHMAINIGTSSLNYLYKDANPIVRGKHYAMVVQALFSKTAGFLNVWRDGIQIVNYKGVLGTGAATYWKEGVYRHSAAETLAAQYRGLTLTAGAQAPPAPPPVIVPPPPQLLQAVRVLVGSDKTIDNVWWDGAHYWAKVISADGTTSSLVKLCT